jgi:hypothetical protein
MALPKTLRVSRKSGRRFCGKDVSKTAMQSASRSYPIGMRFTRTVGVGSEASLADFLLLAAKQR